MFGSCTCNRYDLSKWRSECEAVENFNIDREQCGKQPRVLGDSRRLIYLMLSRTFADNVCYF